MQGRKLSHNIRTKPKLVIQRPQGQETLCLASNLNKNASVFKLMHNKQNQKEGLRLLEHQSLEKKLKPEGFKTKALFIHRASVAKSSSRKSLKSINDQTQNVDKQAINLHIQSLLNRLESNSLQGDRRISKLPRTKMRRALSLVLEENYTNIKRLEQLQNRINQLLQKSYNDQEFIFCYLSIYLQKSQFSSNQQNDSSEAHDTTNHHQRKLAMFRVYNLKMHTSPQKQRISKTRVDVQVGRTEQAIALKELDVRQLCLDSNICSYQVVVQQQKRNIEKEQLALEQLNQVNSYILNQPNKILHQAFRRHRYLQEELFAYADLLSISKMGIMTYTIQANVTQTQKFIDSAMKQTNRQIIQGNYPIQQKCKMLRDFALKVQHFYKPILDQLIKVIDKKTQHSRTFVFKVLKWQQNYITRKEFLTNLKTEYSSALVTISQKLAILQSETCSKSVTKDLAMQIEQNVATINNAFMLGNSFY